MGKSKTIAVNLLLIVALFCANYTFGQSDNPCGAPVLTVNASCTFTAGTNAGATATPTAGIPAPGCASYSGGDVWYQMTVPAGGAFTIDMNSNGGMTDSGMAIYSGTCGAMTLIECDDDDSPNGLMSMITRTGHVAGSTIWVRIWEYGNDNNGTFQICANTPPLPPANDDCGGAYPVTVNPNYLCGSTTAGTVAGATASIQNTTSCGGTENDDVWFSFVATNTTHSIDLLNVAGSTTDMYHSVWSGACPALTVVAGTCSDPNNQVVSGLTVGVTYYIRVYTWSATAGATSTFNVCVGTPPPPPANDNCAGAFSVTVNSGAGCGSTTAGTVASATASPQDATACGGTENDDVWFSFVASSNTHTINLLNITGSTTDMYHSVWSGTCPALSLVAGTCSDPNSSTVSGLTVGNTYYIRVYTWSSTTGATSAFNVCVGTPPPTGPCGNPTNNDYCSNPATLTQGPGSWTSSTSATYTADNPPGIGIFCGSIENNSWYQFTAANTTEVFNFTNVSGCTNNWGIQAQVYSVTTSGLGCCTGFSSVSNCMNPGTNVNGTVTATGLTIGNTYILMVDGNAGDQCNFTVAGWTATGILPVQMINLRALGMEEGNLISWQTVSELNNDYFEILKSTDGIDFSPIGKILGNGNSNSIINYDFFDSNIRIGTSYYKIKQFDYNGESVLSEIVAVERVSEEEGIIAAYPNPMDNFITIELKSNKKINGVVDITNTNGQVMLSKEVYGKNILIESFDVSEFENGLYFISYEDENMKSTKKIIKN